MTSNYCKQNPEKVVKQVDVIIRNGTILTMDNQNRTIENGFLCIQKDLITHIGDSSSDLFKAETDIDAKGGLILPGLVNSHTHAAMSLFRGLADDLPLMEWLNNYVFPVEGQMDANFVFIGALLACSEMILSGTTTFCDMYLFEDEVAKAANQTGLRCMVGEVLYDFPSPNYGPLEKGFEYTESLIEKWRGNPLVSIAVEPHSLYTCGPNLLRTATRIAQRHHVPIVIHLAETLQELTAIEEKYGHKPVAHLLSLDLLGPTLIADHCVHLDLSDIEVLAKHDVKIVHNPESNMKLAAGIAPVPEMMKQGLTVGLGTDGCASNNNLDLFTEMDMTAKLHKIHTMDPTIMDARTVLRMATIGGAKVLGLGDITGSLEVGKKADIIIVDINKPHLTPIYNPYSHLVYSAKGSDVSHSLINGRLIMKDRKLLTICPDEIMALSKEKAISVQKWLRK